MSGYTYKLQIDFGHAGDYSHALANVTNRFRRDFVLTTGFQQPYAEVASPSSFDFKLLNIDRALSPDNTAGAYYGLLTQGTLVKFTASYNSTAYITWIGKIEKVLPQSDPHKNPSGNNYINIIATDFTEVLMNAQIFPALQTDILVHDALVYVMNLAATKVVLPYESTYGVVGVAKVGTAKVMQNNLFTYSESTTTIPFVGDNSADEKNTVGVGSMIKDLLSAELGGRFFWNGTLGKFEFQHRYYGIESALAGAALELDASDIESIDYRAQEPVVNDVTVTYQPREVGTPASVIYSSEREILIEAYQTRTVTAHFRDPDTQKSIGATDILDIVPGTDMIANNTVGGGGVDLTAYVGISQEKRAQSVKITLANTLSGTVVITTLQVRGTPIKTYQRETVVAVDAQSGSDHRRAPKTYTLKLVGDEETAQGFANIQVARFRDPIARFATITYLANSKTKLLTSTASIGQTVSVNEQSATKHTREYTLTGIVHRGDVNGQHKTTLYLSPIAREQYWILGVPDYSELDSTAIVAL